MKKKIFALTLSVVMTGMALAGCGGSGAGSQSDGPTLSQEEADENLDYEYGEGKTFYSEEPMTYSMMYSDHENYPYQEDWLLWKAIEEKQMSHLILRQLRERIITIRCQHLLIVEALRILFPKSTIRQLMKTVDRSFQLVTGYNICRIIRTV